MPSSSNSCVAVAQRRDPLARRGGRFHVGAGAAVYGLAQVVAQQVEHGQELPVLQRRAGLFDQGRHADQRAAQSVVQVARDIQPVLQPAVGQRQLVFAGQRDGQLIAARCTDISSFSLKRSMRRTLRAWRNPWTADMPISTAMLV